MVRRYLFDLLLLLLLLFHIMNMIMRYYDTILYQFSLSICIRMEIKVRKYVHFIDVKWMYVSCRDFHILLITYSCLKLTTCSRAQNALQLSFRELSLAS